MDRYFRSLIKRRRADFPAVQKCDEPSRPLWKSGDYMIKAEVCCSQTTEATCTSRRASRSASSRQKLYALICGMPWLRTFVRGYELCGWRPLLKGQVSLFVGIMGLSWLLRRRYGVAVEYGSHHCCDSWIKDAGYYLNHLFQSCIASFSLSHNSWFRCPMTGA